MPSVGANVPAESDLLCETCGYTLNGLAPDGRCPECGAPVADSVGTHRRPPAWEQTGRPIAILPFISTTCALIFRPTRFYRTFTAHGPIRPALTFAAIHWLIASLLFMIAACLHADWYKMKLMRSGHLAGGWWVILFIGIYAALPCITNLAARLTVVEGAYRRYRLPLKSVLRGLYYHAAHLLPVAVVAAGTVVGYQQLLHYGVLDLTSARMYLYVLSGEVVLCAAYLFETYWVAMKNMMYANR